MRVASTHKSRKSGFTLIEMIIATTLFLLILSAFSMSTRTTTEYYERTSWQSRLDRRAHRALERVRVELIDAGLGTLAPTPTAPLGASTLQFQGVMGTDGVSPLWGETNQIEYAMDPNELNNGLDDDGDGLIDEGQVSFVRNPGQADEMRIVLCKGVSEFLDGEVPNGLDDNGNGLVDEPGLCFELVNSVLRIRLSVTGVDTDGDVQTRYVESAVRLRN